MRAGHLFWWLPPLRLLIVISISTLIAGCHAKDIYRVARLNLAITGKFGGNAVQTAITADSTSEQIYVSVVIRDDRRSAMDTSARLVFADSVARFTLQWFDRQRLIGIRLVLTGSNSSGGRAVQAATFLAVFVPEYQPDGSVRIHRLDISRAS